MVMLGSSSTERISTSAATLVALALLHADGDGSRRDAGAYPPPVQYASSHEHISARQCSTLSRAR